jgi:peptidoglycan/LPS O-acetylase OafA/YrhL
MLCLTVAVLAIWRLAPINSIEAAMVARYDDVASEQSYSFVRWIFYYTPYARISEFLLGALTAHLFMQGPRQDASIWAGPSALIALVFSIWLQIHLPPGPFAWSFGIAPFIALAIYLCARFPRNVVARALSCRPVAVLGGASYSIYLLHPIVLAAFRMSESELANATLVHSLARASLTLFLILGLSLGSYRYFETPARQFIRALRPRAARPNHAEAYPAQ